MPALGLRCALCEPNFYMDSEAYLCTECQGEYGFQTSSLTTAPFVMLYILAGVLIVALISNTVVKTRLDYNGDGRVDLHDLIYFGIKTHPAITNFLIHLVESSMVKILLTFYQIASPLALNLGVKFPPHVTQALESFNFVTFDILPSLNLSCFTLVFTSGYDAIHGLIITTLWPIAASFVILVVIPLTKAYVSGSSYLTEAKGFVYYFLLLTFVVYISTCTEIFRFFKCDDFEDIGKSYLEFDYNVSCYDNRYESTRTFVLLMIVLWPVGIPVVYAASLFRHRHILVDPPPKRKLCFARNTSGDYLLLTRSHESGIMVTEHKHKLPWTSWNEESGKYTAGDEQCVQ